jgi:hypothetical protein
MVILQIIGISYLLFNALSGIVACIWLMVLGEWGAIGIGLVLAIGGHFLIGLAMMPGMILAIPIVFFEKLKIKIAMYFFGLLSLAYTYLILSVWCIACLLYFENMAADGTDIPYLIWGYTVAFAPIAFLASKERDNEFTSFAAFTIKACLVVSLLGLFLFDLTFPSLPLVFVIGFLGYAVVALLMQRRNLQRG